MIYKNFLYHGSCTTSILIALCMSSSAAFAQDEAANSAAQTSTGIGEIVVTAQRREQSLQDTPIAVTAFTSETLEQARVQSFGDLITKIPGFSINSFTKSRQSVALRGGSSSLSSPGSDNAVALFIDDIYFGASGDFETANLFDLERIEVLRGPQGTLFGRNSTGGAIMIVTKDPVPGPTGAVELSVGNYDLVQAKGFVSGSLNDSDTILGSLAFAATNQDGTSYNRATDERIDDVNRVSIRGKIKWLMAEDVSLLVTGSYGKVNETNEARDFLGATPTADSLEAIGFVPDRNPRVVDQFSSGRFNSRNWLVSAKLEARFDSGIFTSITGYRDNNSDQTPSDYVGTPVRMFSIAEPRHLKQFSQEFRWVSATSGPLDWTAGLYFLHQSDRRSSFTETFYDPSTFAGARQAGVLCPGIQGDERNFALPACVAAFPERFDPDNPNEVERFQRSSVYSYAAYLEGSYELTDQLTLTLGGRITHDRKTASGGARGDLDWVLNPLANASPGGFEGTAAGWRVSGLEKSWTAFTPRAIVDWKPSEEILVYGTISRGVRSGAYSFGSIEATSVVPVEPEFVWNYEIGMKRQFFDNRARLNLAAFQANYKGAQFFYFDNTAGSYIFDNAGKSRVRGIEVEATLIPVRGLTLSSNYTYQTGKISGFPPESGLENGITPAQTPKHTLNLGASYEVALASGGTLGIFGDFQYKSKYQLETDPSPAFTSRVKGLVNGSIAYTTPNERWVLSVWGKNLTNENIKVYGNDFKFLLYTFDEAYNSSSPNFNPDADTANMPRYAPPRTFGASLKYSF